MNEATFTPETVLGSQQGDYIFNVNGHFMPSDELANFYSAVSLLRVKPRRNGCLRFK